jgi:uncharacterized protein
LARDHELPHGFWRLAVPAEMQVKCLAARHRNCDDQGMKYVGWSALVLVLALAGRAADMPVSITPELHGAWFRPERGWDGRTVLLLHGFADDMDGAGDLTKRLAGELAAKGIASLRINFRGEGDKRRTMIESTLATRLEDTVAAYAWLTDQPGVNASRLGVQGWSLGASTAIEIGAHYPAWFRSLALWSSPSGDHFALYRENPTAQAALRDGVATEDVPGWKKITTKRAFYESFRGVNLDQSLAKYPGAFLTVRGTQDFLPPRDDALLAAAPGEPKEKLILEGADHIFNVFQPETGHAQRVIAATVGWFERTL